MSGAPLPIRPDMGQAIKEFGELVELSGRFRFDLSGFLDSLLELRTPVFICDVDDLGAPATGHAVACYKLAERLQGVLAALRARDRESHVVERVVCQDLPPSDVFPPESALEQLAQILRSKMEHLDPTETGDMKWDQLRERDREFYRLLIEELLIRGELIDAALRQFADDYGVEGGGERGEQLKLNQ